MWKSTRIAKWRLASSKTKLISISSEYGRYLSLAPLHFQLYLKSQWRLSRLKPGGRRSEKAGLEGRKAVCILVHATCYCEHNAYRHAPLERVQTSRFLLIGQRPVVVKTGRPHAGDARTSRPRTPQGQVNNFGHITISTKAILVKLCVICHLKAWTLLTIVA